MENNLQQHDDHKVFKHYFDAYYVAIHHFLYYKTGDVDIADDAVQHVFMRLWEIRHTVKSETVKALLYAIATNILRNHFKHQKVVYNFVAKNSNNENMAEAADFEIQQKEFNDKLQRVLALMPEKSRVIFLMNRIDGLTYNEIATRLDLSVKAIEKRMHKALEIVKLNINYKI